MRNDAYAKAVANGLEDTDSNWLDFDEKFYDHLINKGYKIAD